ncbi:MAG: hypothetical protein H3Z50_01000 [archaeon]|nr:hypothetical protein [archaeon]MCP8305749.1 hypothetical protein [archaeon]
MSDDLKSVREMYRGQRYMDFEFPEELLCGRLVRDRIFRYGENPGQHAAFYKQVDVKGPSLATANILKENPDKKLGYINFLDADAAIKILRRFKQLYPNEAVSTVIKHTNPTGIAKAKTIFEAYRTAWDCDSLSAFGSVVGFSDVVNEEVAKDLSQKFVEVLVAPEYEPEALEVLDKKRDLRIMQIESLEKPLLDDGFDYRSVQGGILVQQRFQSKIDSEANFEVVSKRQPEKREIDAAIFNWATLPFIDSNAIVIGDENKTLGIGAGQRSRIYSARLAAYYANTQSKDPTGTKGKVMASDAFFPHRDCIDLAGVCGIRAIVCPIGSINDEKIIQAVNEYDMVMLVTRPVLGNRTLCERAFSH